MLVFPLRDLECKIRVITLMVTLSKHEQYTHINTW